MDFPAVARPASCLTTLLQECFQDHILADFCANPLYSRVRHVLRHAAALERMPDSDRAPAILLHPARGKIIRVFRVVEKVEGGQVLQHLFDCGCVSGAKQSLTQLATAAGAPGQDQTRLSEKPLVRLVLR